MARWLVVQDFSFADEDADYISSQTNGQVCLIKCGSLPAIPPVAMVNYVSLSLRARSVSGLPKFAPRIHSGASFQEGLQVTPFGTYSDFVGSTADPTWRAVVDPATGLPWTYDAARAAHVGILYKQGLPNPIRCTQIRKLIDVTCDVSVNAVRVP